MENYFPQVSIAEARQILRAAFTANRVVTFIGAPGVGKTAIVQTVAAEMELPLVTLIGSNLDPTDVGGFPVVRDDGSFDRVPMRDLRDMADVRKMLFLDELSCASAPVRASFLRLMHERVAGDIRLRADTPIVAAMNPPEMSPGGFELEAPVTNRMGIYEFVPTTTEVSRFFIDVLGEGNDAFADLAAEWGSLLFSTQLELLQLSPPEVSLAEGAPWGSPRAWESGLRMLAALDSNATESLQLAILAGSVGFASANAFLAIRKLRHLLPTLDEVLDDPAGAKVPDGFEQQLSAIGLLHQVSRQDPCAAWVYAERLELEVAAVAANGLRRVNMSRGSAKHKAAAMKARVMLLGQIANQLDSEDDDDE